MYWLPLIARFMGPTWGSLGADRTQVGPLLAPWTLISRTLWMTVIYQICLLVPAILNPSYIWHVIVIHKVFAIDKTLISNLCSKQRLRTLVTTFLSISPFLMWLLLLNIRLIMFVRITLFHINVYICYVELIILSHISVYIYCVELIIWSRQ